MSEGRDLAGEFNSANFFEVSIADNPYESISILEKVVRDIIRMKKVCKIFIKYVCTKCLSVSSDTLVGTMNVVFYF